MKDRIAAWSTATDARATNRGSTLEERLRHYARSMSYWSTDPGVRAFAELIRECWGTARHVAEEIEALRTERTKAALVQDIEALAAKEGLPIASPRFVADLFLSMMSATGRSNASETERRIDQAVSILLHGVARASK